MRHLTFTIVQAFAISVPVVFAIASTANKKSRLKGLRALICHGNSFGLGLRLVSSSKIVSAIVFAAGWSTVMRSAVFANILPESEGVAFSDATSRTARAALELHVTASLISLAGVFAIRTFIPPVFKLIGLPTARPCSTAAPSDAYSRLSWFAILSSHLFSFITGITAAVTTYATYLFGLTYLLDESSPLTVRSTAQAALMLHIAHYICIFGFLLCTVVVKLMRGEARRLYLADCKKQLERQRKILKDYVSSLRTNDLTTRAQHDKILTKIVGNFDKIKRRASAFERAYWKKASIHTARTLELARTRAAHRHEFTELKATHLREVAALAAAHRREQEEYAADRDHLLLELDIAREKAVETDDALCALGQDIADLCHANDDLQLTAAARQSDRDILMLQLEDLHDRHAAQLVHREEEISKLSEYILRLHAREDDLHSMLEAEMAARQRDAEAFDAENAALRARSIALMEELAADRSALYEVEDALRKRLDAIVEEDVAAFEERLRLEAAFAVVSLGADHLQCVLSTTQEALSQSTANLIQAQSTIATLEADRTSLRDELAAEKVAFTGTAFELSTARRALRENQDGLRSLEEKTTELSHQLNFSRLENVELKADIVQAQDALSVERQTSGDLADKIANATVQIEKLRAELSTSEERLREAMEGAAKSMAKTKAEVRMRKAEIKALKTASQDLSDRLQVSEAARMEADAQWATTTEEALFAEVKLRREEEVHQEIVQALERELKASSDEHRKLDKLRDALADKVRDLQSLNNVLRIRVNALLESEKAKAEALVSAEARLEETHAQLEEAGSQVSGARVAHLQRAIAGLQESLESMQEQNCVFKSLMQDEISGRVKAEEETSRLRSQLAAFSVVNSLAPPTPVIPPPVLMPSSSSQQSSLIATPDFSRCTVLPTSLGSSDCLFEGASIVESITVTMGLGLDV